MLLIYVHHWQLVYIELNVWRLFVVYKLSVLRCVHISPYANCAPRGDEPNRGKSLWGGGNQHSSKLGPSSARDGRKLLHRILRPAQWQAPHLHCQPNAKLHAPQRPPTGYHLLGDRYCAAHLGQGEGHVCQSVYSGRWVSWRQCNWF